MTYAFLHNSREVLHLGSCKGHDYYRRHVFLFLILLVFFFFFFLSLLAVAEVGGGR